MNGSRSGGCSRGCSYRPGIEDRSAHGLDVPARLLLRAEGLASSAIEGIHASAEEVALAEAAGDGESISGPVAAWVSDNLAVVTASLDEAGRLDEGKLLGWHRRLMRHGQGIESRHVGAVPGPARLGRRVDSPHGSKPSRPPRVPVVLGDGGRPEGFSTFSGGDRGRSTPGSGTTSSLNRRSRSISSRTGQTKTRCTPASRKVASGGQRVSTRPAARRSGGGSPRASGRSGRR